MKEVSIIIPIYNVEKYVAECLNSVISQTYDHSKIECIIVNDCTTDDSMDIIDRIIKKYQSDNGKMSFNVINHERNMGISVSRNDGIDTAKGEYVFFIDSDDYLYPDCLKSLYDAHLMHKDAELIIGNAYNEMLTSKQFDINNIKVINNLNYLFEGSLAHYTIWNMLIKRNVLNKHNIKFKTDVNVSEDDLFNFHLYSLVNKAIIIPQITYFYRKNNKGQTLNSKFENAQNTFTGYISILKIYENELQGRCYVGKSFFAFNLATRAIDFLNKVRNEVPEVELQERPLRQIINKIQKKHIRNCRPILYLMTLLATKPFEGIMRIRFYRRYFNRITMLFWKPSVLMDKILSHIQK